MGIASDWAGPSAAGCPICKDGLTTIHLCIDDDHVADSRPRVAEGLATSNSEAEVRDCGLAAGQASGLPVDRDRGSCVGCTFQQTSNSQLRGIASARILQRAPIYRTRPAPDAASPLSTAHSAASALAARQAQQRLHRLDRALRRDS